MANALTHKTWTSHFPHSNRKNKINGKPCSNPLQPRGSFQSNFTRDIKGIPVIKKESIEIVEVAEAIDMPNDDTEIKKDPVDDRCEADLLKGISILDFFHKDIVLHFLENGNSKTARVMGINLEYVGKLVKESKQQIEKFLEDNMQ